MTRVLVAASINNELESRDVSAVKQLQRAGYDIQFYYYLPKVPAQFTMIPSFNEELKGWKTHAAKMLTELGQKLSIPASNCHFINEVLGPDQLFEEARALKVKVILTNKKDQLKHSILARFYDWISDIFTDKKVKEIPVEEVRKFASQELAKMPSSDDKIVSIKSRQQTSYQKPKTGTKG